MAAEKASFAAFEKAAFAKKKADEDAAAAKKAEDEAASAKKAAEASTQKKAEEAAAEKKALEAAAAKESTAASPGKASAEKGLWPQVCFFRTPPVRHQCVSTQTLHSKPHVERESGAGWLRAALPSSPGRFAVALQMNYCHHQPSGLDPTDQSRFLNSFL